MNYPVKTILGKTCWLDIIQSGDTNSNMKTNFKDTNVIEDFTFLFKIPFNVHKYMLVINLYHYVNN